MGKWKRVWRCKECGRIYEVLPSLCSKCGASIGRPNYIARMIFNKNIVIPTGNTDIVTARKKLLGKWEISEVAQNESEGDES